MVIIRFGPYSFQPFTVIIYILQSSAVQTRPTNSPYKLQPASNRRCSPNTETGKRVPPTETLILLSDFYGVSIDYILKRTDKPEINR